MKLISQGGQYAISAIIAISKNPKKIIPATELAKHLNCPAAYLSQILSKLKQPGILGSRRGINGGVYLALPLINITVYDVIFAIDGEKFFTDCFMGIDGCEDIDPCPFHYFWSTQRENIKQWLMDTNFDDAEKLISETWFNERLSF